MNGAKLSMALSHALRHEPWLYELELDDEGWAPVEAILVALRREHEAWSGLSRADLEQVLTSSSKRRFEIADDKIRALYGHSLPGKLRRERASPPAVLFHGTSPEAVRTILEEGLRPMSRQYVHLSVAPSVALEVGRRKAKSPQLIEVESRAAHEAGAAFYAGNHQVWLADLVPARFLRMG